MNAKKSDDKCENADICQRVLKVRQMKYGSRGKASFARDLGISPSTYDYYENKRVPPVDVLVRMAELAEVDVRWLLTGKKKFADANITINPLAKRLDSLLERIPGAESAVQSFLDAMEQAFVAGAVPFAQDSPGFEARSESRTTRYIDVDIASISSAEAEDSGSETGGLSPSVASKQSPSQGSAISGSLVAGFVPLQKQPDRQSGQNLASDDGLAANSEDQMAAFGEHQGWIPVLGRSAAGVPQFWAEFDGDKSSSGSVTMLEDLVAAMKPRKARPARRAMADGELAPSGGAQIVLLDAPESPGTAEFIIAEHISDSYNDLFALRIDGESMEPEICHGDVVILSPNCPAEPGSAAVVQLDNQIGVTCKLIRYDGDRVHLIPVNESFAPSVHPADSVRWALKVIACVRSV